MTRMPLFDSAFTYLVCSVFQGVVALIWVGGIRKYAGPLQPVTHGHLLEISLILPVFTTIFRILGVPGFPDTWTLIRASAWANAIRDGNAAFKIATGVLFIGTALIFLFQEVLPLWRGRGHRLNGQRFTDPKLTALVDGLFEEFRKKGVLMVSRKHVRAFVVASSEPIAALDGIAEPVLLVSRRLLEDLEDTELETVLAHEISHLVYGGNIALIFAWIVRALQIANPAALIAFRNLVEVREYACDTLASYVTGKPATLASALIKASDSSPLTQDERRTAWLRARNEVLRHAEIESTRLRVRSLLDSPVARPQTGNITFISLALLGGILWAIR